jgi:signal transduction histidine kinase
MTPLQTLMIDALQQRLQHLRANTHRIGPGVRTHLKPVSRSKYAPPPTRGDLDAGYTTTRQQIRAANRAAEKHRIRQVSEFIRKTNAQETERRRIAREQREYLRRQQFPAYNPTLRQA